jgi:hypothetical protein
MIVSGTNLLAHLFLGGLGSFAKGDYNNATNSASDAARRPRFITGITKTSRPKSPASLLAPLLALLIFGSTDGFAAAHSGPSRGILVQLSQPSDRPQQFRRFDLLRHVVFGRQMAYRIWADTASAARVLLWILRK